MLSQDEFTAMLQRYAAGQCSAAEQYLLDQWLAQPATPSQPQPAEKELAQMRAAMWQRIEQATKVTEPYGADQCQP